MTYSPHQLAYFAHRLTLRGAAGSMDRMAGALFDAQVDLNPHQVDAALFAAGNPLSKGVILADEVGLGKTIEAGLLLAQRWAERRRRLLIIAPANLRKQWHQELADKFALPAVILESRSFRLALKEGCTNPFDVAAGRDGNGPGAASIVICSYQFAAGKARELAAVPWDLVVIDEAHRLRNVYKPENKTANLLRDALAASRKVLLTATPLQNTLLELYGLVSFIDDRVFGDLDSFRQQFGALRDEASFAALKHRIGPVCKRTLRRQVEAYVKYTRRIPLLEEFKPGADEVRLYELVSEYLQRDRLYALPNAQRQLITLVLRKLLASSSFAIGGALDTLIRRLQESLHDQLAAPQSETLSEALDADYESLDETADETAASEAAEDAGIAAERAKTVQERAAVQAEIADLEGFRDLALSITDNAKGQALLKALDVAFGRLKELGAAQKAIIFTESRRTQDYLLALLGQTEHAVGVVLFNGSNSDPLARRLHAEWVEQHRGTSRITGSRAADTRAALVDHFRDNGKIMIATEAGAEGINLQFCSLVINYDLPWNPQRIEQRIGRCHRYGQKHDVVVVNFVNRDNEADRRVFQLLDQKFKLFDGVFGASDEVLGALESGVDFERRIADIYQNCRHPNEIHTAFEQLQLDLAGEISDAMLGARRALLENFDEEVQERLKVAQADATAALGRMERLLMRLTRGMLGSHAQFDPEGNGFTLHALPGQPVGDASQSGIAGTEAAIPLGRYELPRRSEEAHVYRLQHPLAQHLIDLAKRASLLPRRLQLDYAAYNAKVSVLESLRGEQGHCVVQCLRVESLGSAEEHLLVAATVGGTVLEPDVADRLLALPGAAEPCLSQDSTLTEALTAELSRQQAQVLGAVEARNLKLFTAETEKLDAWADDQRASLEQQLADLQRRIKEVRTRSKGAATLAEKLAVQREQRDLEAARDRRRRELFARQDEIQAKRDGLIDALELQLEQQVSTQTLLRCEWAMQ
ncbi:SNF2-related protein [uncultured Methylibium sp.]|uniref:SNF2-related protein n=1 Tax=uncultured Methylibium sp. TaxID=381093 RepID=UPI003456FA8F